MNQKSVVITNNTKEKVEAAKIFIEQRYSKLIHQEIQKKQYWDQLNQKMKNLNLNNAQQQLIKKTILHKEAQRLRSQRVKISVQDFESVKIVGKGAFGQVRLCKWKKNNNPVAVKKLKKSEMIFKNKVIQVRQQRNVLANSDKNPWIVSLKCSFQDPDNLYLVMDYIPGGDLMNLLIKKDIFTHQEARFYTAEMILAIHSVHKLNYIHRDIKPDNILIDEKGHIKLSDFGLCKHTEMRPKKMLENLRRTGNSTEKIPPSMRSQLESAKQLKHRRRKLAYSAVGTPDYVAPEVQGKNGYTETVDWWSLGVIFYEMLVGYPPFASEQSSITWQKIQNWRKYLVIPRDADVSPEAADLIRKLINDPEVRLGVNGVEQIMRHPFFAGVDWKNIRDKKAPNIPVLKNPFDTTNFDPFEQDEPWIPYDQKPQKFRNKKGTQFIGYTFKPEQQGNSELLKALIDLDNYRIPQQLHKNGLQSLYLQSNYSVETLVKNKNFLFKKQKANNGKNYIIASTQSPKYLNSTKKGFNQSKNKNSNPNSLDKNEGYRFSNSKAPSNSKHHNLMKQQHKKQDLHLNQGPLQSTPSNIRNYNLGNSTNSNYNSSQGSTKKISQKKSQSPSLKDTKRPLTAALGTKAKFMTKKNIECKR